MRAIFLFLLSFLTIELFAQERCATEYLPFNTKRIETGDQFEEWIQKKVSAGKLQNRAFAQEQIYTIPVVFHVIHDGSTIGSGSNLSEARILEQLEILNKDFSRTNADTSNTPEEFLSVASNPNIQFVLAKQDPEGLPTSGIVRIQGKKKTYEPTEAYTMISQSYWPQQDYMNIYITDLTTGNLGYAQFPFSNLDGILQDLNNYIITDAVVLDYKWTGKNTNTGGFDSYGRTATHEIGHFLGLKHVWGSGGCFNDDYCSDTPSASSWTTGCPSEKATCDEKEMIQNYMDYTDDVCMNLFTICQKTRMRTVLEQSPRRASLLTSHALEEPKLVNLDLGIRSIITPAQSSCSEQLVPGIQVRNYGSTKITQCEVAWYLNDQLVENKTVNLNLASGETSEIIFNTKTIDPSLVNQFRFEIVAANNDFDMNSDNDQKVKTIAPFQSQVVPYEVDFSEGITLFTQTENNQPSQWKSASEIGASGVYLDFYNNPTNFGYRDIIQTTTLDLSALTSAQLDFKYAYASRTSDKLDGLIVVVSTDCGQTFPDGNIIFEKYAKYLPTAGSSDFSFIPSNSSDWESVNINITEFAGQDQVQIAFMGVNGSGNNLYLDDISVSSANLLPYDLGIRSAVDFPVILCENQTNFNPRLELKNYGYTTINEMVINVVVNGATEQFTLNSRSLKSGETYPFTLNTTSALNTGLNEFEFQVVSINGQSDPQTNNNNLILFTEVNEDSENLPIQEKFESPAWTIVNPGGDEFLEFTKLNGNSVLSSKSYQNPVIGKSYLISPVIETKDYPEGAIRFDYSYAQTPGTNDNLKVLLSTNCGLTFDVELLSLNSEQMAVSTTNSQWVPTSESDWKQAFIDISEYLEWNDLRIAFAFTNGNGNTLYIDNLNLLTTNDPTLPEFENQVMLYPNPAPAEFHLAFNLSEKSNLQIQVIDMSGKVVFDENYSDMINQTLTLRAPNQGGFYFVRVLGKGINKTQRVFIQR